MPPLEGKFSTRFCVALGLRDYRVVASDFTEKAMRNPSVVELLPLSSSSRARSTQLHRLSGCVSRGLAESCARRSAALSRTSGKSAELGRSGDEVRRPRRTDSRQQTGRGHLRRGSRFRKPRRSCAAPLVDRIHALASSKAAATASLVEPFFKQTSGDRILNRNRAMYVSRAGWSALIVAVVSWTSAGLAAESKPDRAGRSRRRCKPRRRDGPHRAHRTWGARAQ